VSGLQPELLAFTRGADFLVVHNLSASAQQFRRGLRPARDVLTGRAFSAGPDGSLALTLQPYESLWLSFDHS
jgi:hypothetical protein